MIANGTAAGAFVNEVIGIRQLPYGGFVSLELNVATSTGSPYEVSVRSVDGTIVQTFKLPVSGGAGDFSVFPNNTLWTTGRDSSNLLVVFTSLPKLLQEGEQSTIHSMTNECI